ncbi:hypothetical protein CWI38_1227p0030 [Hamiltosporidium tvaerminnensis]|uniref:Uncharacterized protein n=2 Tax=Hamiltosporidium TaxID=1176354 RepID=A0A4Q9KZG3_9MICR|nr:hypothetical protein CWI39_1687p0010 [Hamiltosporidium magnivora]TBU11399.1 hypothetical protein CWI38_1227p0030 [Hamiltosporidium tvaerminnensis]
MFLIFFVCIFTSPNIFTESKNESVQHVEGAQNLPENSYLNPRRYRKLKCSCANFLAEEKIKIENSKAKRKIDFGSQSSEYTNNLQDILRKRLNESNNLEEDSKNKKILKKNN